MRQPSFADSKSDANPIVALCHADQAALYCGVTIVSNLPSPHRQLD
jgi:hypothetical protein